MDRYTGAMFPYRALLWLVIPGRFHVSLSEIPFCKSLMECVDGTVYTGKARDKPRLVASGGVWS